MVMDHYRQVRWPAVLLSPCFRDSHRVLYRHNGVLNHCA
jgi:hypothetical protein